MSNECIVLPRNENQARGIGQYAIDFLAEKWAGPAESVFEKVEQFHLDSIACAVSALACGANAPRVLREEALEYVCQELGEGVPVLGSRANLMPEKAVVANSSAVREWDANGTNFGYNPDRGATRGEFGHNDFYPVAVAAAQLCGLDGRQTLKAMILLDEIRGRLAEVFALKNYKIDHVVHGAIGSAATFGAVMGATAEQIESAIGMVVAQLYSVSRDSGGQAAFRLQGSFGGDQRRSGRAQHAPRHAGLCRTGRHLSQSRGDLLSV